MAETIKISDLPELTTPTSSLTDKYLLVTDASVATPVSKKISLNTLDTLLDISQNKANLAFNRANNSIDANNGGTITGDLRVTNNLFVGNVFVTGQTFSVNASTLVSNDTVIILGEGNYFLDSRDLGFAAHYNNGINAHSGLIRDSDSKEWYLFKEYTPEVGTNNNININDASFIVDTLNANVKSTVVLSKGIDLLIRTNTIFDLANGTAIAANTPSDVANSAAIYANGAFAAANAATATDLTQNNSITAAFNHANASFANSNTYITYNEAVNLTQNNSITAAFNHANASFANSNSYITNAEATNVTQNNSIAAAFNHANASFANSNTYITSAEAVNITQNNSIIASFNHANSSFNYSNAVSNLALSFSATTILEVLNSGASAYRFTQYGALDNPNVTTLSATTLGFKLNVSGHPFHIRTGDNTADYNTGLVHVSTTGVLSYDSAAQGKESGTLFWRIPHTSVGNYKYRCVNHPGAMLGDINIANTAAIYFAYNT